MRARLLAGFLAFAAIVGAALEIPLGFSLEARDQASAVSLVEQGASSLGLVLSAELENGGNAGKVARQYGVSTGSVVIVASGKDVLVEVGPDASEELSEPGVVWFERAARHGKVAGGIPARDGDDSLLYAAIPLESIARLPSGAHPVLLVASPSTALSERVRRDWLLLVGFGLAMVAVALLAGMLLARSLTRPLSLIEAAVGALGDGDLECRAPAGAGPAELRELASSVNAMAARIAELLSAQRAFVADASHQLRSPLTALRLRLENLGRARGLFGDPALVAMSAEIERLSRVVDGLLMLARAEGVRPERSSLDVAAVVEERARSWEAFAAEQGVTLEVRHGANPAGPARPLPALPAPFGGSRLARSGSEEGSAGAVQGCMAIAVPGSLEQILDNLLANAFEAAPSGTTVQLLVCRVGESIEIHVVDHGPGMSATERARASQRFWRSERAAPGGSGLGLAIVEQLARASGGTVGLGESEGGGLDAVVRLRAAKKVC